ncbi:MAG: flagellar export chaperone FlgN [Lachnospiraceae bacterium]|nr:flagellar export chaperone FlgN [Lachnospiraceae bacterium]
MSKEHITALRDSLVKKVSILEEIEHLDRLQNEILNKEPFDYEAFDRLFTDKDVCMEKIEKLDEGFELVYERVESELKENKDSYSDIIKEMQDLISRITELGTSVTAAEERNRNALSDTIIRERKGMAEGKRSVNVAMNYYKNMNGLNSLESRFMDKKK